MAAEDKNFFTHFGIDFQALLRAIYRNVRNGSRQGASTITQQLTKNLLLSNEQTYSRKAKEAIMNKIIDAQMSNELGPD